MADDSQLSTSVYATEKIPVGWTSKDLSIRVVDGKFRGKYYSLRVIATVPLHLCLRVKGRKRH